MDKAFKDELKNDSTYSLYLLSNNHEYDFDDESIDKVSELKRITSLLQEESDIDSLRLAALSYLFQYTVAMEQLDDAESVLAYYKG